MPRVSVIMPAYNAAAFLPEALDSVLAQTYRDWEIVVADDGSTDATRAVIEAREPDFGGRLRYFVQRNRGVSAARNLALRHARGELLAFLDADDVWLPQRLERGVAVLDSQPSAGLVHSRVRRIDRQSRPASPPSPPPLRYLQGNIAAHLYTRRAHILTLTVLVRRVCLNRVGLFDETLPVTEDRDLWFRVAALFNVAYLDEELACYRTGGNSLSGNWERMCASQLRFLEKHRASGAANQRQYRQALANVHRERGDVLFNLGQLRDSLRHYGRSVVYDAGNVRNVYMLLRALAEPGLSRLRGPHASALTERL